MLARVRTAALILGTVLLSDAAYACPVCFGDPESDQAKAVTFAVATMLGTTITVLIGVAAFGVYIWRRAAAAESEGDRG